MKQQTFSPLSGKRLVAYLRSQFEQLDDSTAQYLIQRVGTNLSRLHSEMDKVLTYMEEEMTGSQKVTTDLIDEVVWGEVETDSFALLDEMYVDAKRAMKRVDLMHEQGTNWNQVIGTLFR